MKLEKRIRSSFLHLGSFGHTATSGWREKLIVLAGYFGRTDSILKISSQKLHRRSGISKYVYVNIAAFYVSIF